MKFWIIITILSIIAALMVIHLYQVYSIEAGYLVKEAH